MYQILKEHFKSFSSAPEQEYDALCSLFQHRSIKKKEYLLKAGEVCDFEAFILKGLFKVYILDQNNEEWILVFAAENWWITDLESFEFLTPSKMYIQALEDCEILYINKEDKERAYEEIPVVNKISRTTIKYAYVLLRDRIFDIIIKSAEERYLDLLAQNPTLAQRLTNIEIAKYLGVTNVFVSNIRNKIAKKSQ